MNTSKPRVIQSYDKLPVELREKLKLTYPLGFSDHLIDLTINNGVYISALPFETEEKLYLIRMSKNIAKDIIRADDDYDRQGNLKDDIRSEYEEKYGEDDVVV